TYSQPRTPASWPKGSPPSAGGSSTAAPPSGRASASASSWATPSRPWPASPSLPAWPVRRCSWASPSPRPSPSSGSSSPSSSPAERKSDMRRAVLAVVVALAVIVPAGTAYAQTTEKKKPDKASEECIKKLESGNNKIDDCQKAPSPILPATNELIWGALSFVLLFYALRRFAYPQLKQSMDARAEKIRNSIDEAERARGEAEQILQQYQRQLSDARSEAARIIEEARQAADKLRQDL